MHPSPSRSTSTVFEGAAWEAGLIARVRTPTPKPVPARVVGRPAPRLSLPPAGGFDRPAPPPIHGYPPDIQLLASVSAPPLSGAVTVEPPVAFMPPPALDKGEPPLPEPSPFVPVPDPGRPGPPSNPPLDPPPGTDLPEPTTAWLMAVAMVAMVARRAKRRPDAVR
ncbi:PEP-CTERM sorting domain-containing protein [Massilia sp. Dwa41.01b]|uniref:PEP-CTERM sorting domain-containing protein n=1 Tax=Massilia sp. Dwa41.01b TaxID=2709302 RepID=UPI0015FF3F70|nr:PEP-CTERM sorting domain-containing protein [Massilia sp. Dwa41.01b]QNA88909.1 PEP-CTERM sorting domain-containing protein [Massilia sp. Dwa41.01b]